MKSADSIWQANQASYSLTTMPCAVPGKFNHNALHTEFLAMTVLSMRQDINVAGLQDKAGFGRIEAGLENPLTKLTGL